MAVPLVVNVGPAKINRGRDFWLGLSALRRSICLQPPVLLYRPISCLEQTFIDVIWGDPKGNRMHPGPGCESQILTIF